MEGAHRTSPSAGRRAPATQQHQHGKHEGDRQLSGERRRRDQRSKIVRPGLIDGALADVATDTGRVRGTRPGSRWRRERAGVNVNLLAADGPERIERVSGMAQLTGMLVDVRPAAGPHDPASWSGLP